MKTYLLSINFFLLPLFSFACTCLYSTGFCETINSSSNIASARILRTYLPPLDSSGFMLEQYVDAVVFETLNGTVEADTVTFRVANGTSCGPVADLTAFPEGSTIIALMSSRVEQPIGQYPTFAVDFACAVGFVVVNGGANSQAYQSFKAGMEDCILKTKTIGREELDRYAKVFPSLAKDYIWLDVPFPLTIRVDIFSVEGKLLQTIPMGQFRSERVDVAAYAAGVYYVRFATERFSVTKRFVKVLG